MSLDVKRLEKARDLADGTVQARCPACAESGGDRKGEHLRVYPDGRFGCCVHPKDREHRRRIHALVGDKSPRVIKVRVAAAKTGGGVQGGILGRLGRVFASPTAAYSTMGGSDASDGVPQAQTRAVEPPRTPRTGVSESKRGAVDASDNSRTLRTPLNPNGYEEEFFGDEREEYCTYKEFAAPVRSVREPEAQPEPAGDVRSVREEAAAGEPPKPAEGETRLPFFTADGTLRIPFDSPERYHWWKPPHDQRQRVATTWNEVKERMKHGAALGGGNPKSEDRRPKAESEEEYYGDGV